MAACGGRFLMLGHELTFYSHDQHNGGKRHTYMTYSKSTTYITGKCRQSTVFFDYGPQLGHIMDLTAQESDLSVSGQRASIFIILVSLFGELCYALNVSM